MNTLTAETLREWLTYDPETGIFRWRRDVLRPGMVAHRPAGSVAGDRDGKGYWRIGLKGRRYAAHRLAWFYVHGRWPDKNPDHINGHRQDNRIANLREATASQNGANRGANRNNTSGYKRVSWNKLLGKWQAHIQVERKQRYLGLFDTPEAAHAAYIEAARIAFGEFARTR